jgi:hypothetical protein
MGRWFRGKNGKKLLKEGTRTDFATTTMLSAGDFPWRDRLFQPRRLTSVWSAASTLGGDLPTQNAFDFRPSAFDHGLLQRFNP